MSKDSWTFSSVKRDSVRNVFVLVLRDLVRVLIQSNRVSLLKEEADVARLEGFFKVLPKSPEELAKQKRKAENAAVAAKAAKKAKTGGKPGRPGGR